MTSNISQAGSFLWKPRLATSCHIKMMLVVFHLNVSNSNMYVVFSNDAVELKNKIKKNMFVICQIFSGSLFTVAQKHARPIVADWTKGSAD